MRLIIQVVAALALLLAISTSAFAGTLEGNVPANRTTRIHAFTVADPAICAVAGKPKMTISTEPKHGKISFKWEYIPAGKKFRNCTGGMMKAMSVYYTPAAGFRGTDSFAVGYSLPDMSDYITIGYRGQKFVLHVK
ncbi:MAG: hypothetical protein JWL86_6177 [Rhizobium sp.]|nr:hypothetical protein [Rhizobium sp.]